MKHVLGLLGLALAAGPTWSAAAPQESSVAAASAQGLPVLDPLVAGLLARGCDAIDAGSVPAAGLVEQLVARPEPLHAALRAVFERGAWRVPGGVDDERVLRERHRPWLRALAARLPAAGVLAAARADLEGGAPPARLRARLVLAGEVARARDVHLLGALAAAAGPRAVADDYGTALLATLLRADGACRELDSAWAGLPSELRLPALDALGASERPQAVGVLGRRLDDQPELRTAVLARLGALAERLEEPPDRHVVASVRMLLGDSRSAVRREAALCVGRMQDGDSAPVLVEMLEQGERGEREAALWALRRVSTLGFSGDPRPWRLWLDDESAWWSERAAFCLSALGDPRAEVALAALDEIARRRLHRDALARAVADMGGVLGELTEHRCHVLRALASRAGLRFLRECLSGAPDEAVRAAAERAWRASTELPLPAAPSGAASRP